MDEEGAPAKPRVSDHDRDYFRRLGEWEAENERLEHERHMARSMAERLAYSWELTKLHGPHLHEDPEEDWAKVHFYAEARRLGLIKQPQLSDEA